MEIVTPHDPEARYRQKLTAAAQRAWIGYRDHQTESCDANGANVIVHVATAPAPEQDIDALKRIHQGLAASRLHPLEHYVDAGYTTPTAIASSARNFGIALIGPVRPDTRAALHPGIAKAHFSIGWASRTLTCPNGNVSPPWKATLPDGQPAISVLFSRKDRRPCPDRLECIGNADDRGRHLTLLPQPPQDIQTKTRGDQETPEWKKRYAIRAGCEATVCETVHAHGPRHCRYKGLAKHVLTAAGTNIIRLFAYDPELEI